MRVKNIKIKNFRRLGSVNIDVEPDKTIFVGPNNSGKTSATVAMRCFIGGKNFKIYDFPASTASDFDAFIANGDNKILPAIELDIWFAVDPNSIAFGRAFRLLPELSTDYTELGIRLKFEADNPDQLRADYLSANPPRECEPNERNLFHYLDTDRNLSKHFHISYYPLRRNASSDIIHSPLNRKEGKRLIESLLRVDFVDAQRNFDDDEKHRSNKLSVAFASYYKKNLEQIDTTTENESQVIDENNQRLTDHYEQHFAELMSVIQGLGVPSVYDRNLSVESSLTPETALQGNTCLFYVDRNSKHKLPEAYNGLGFKNLVYMAIQISHYHLQWIDTVENVSVRKPHIS